MAEFGAYSPIPPRNNRAQGKRDPRAGGPYRVADVLKDAQELYAESMSAMAEQRRQIEEDVKFSDPSNPQQWDEDVKAQRLGDPGGARPCLVMDQTGQYVSNVAGQIEKQPPSIHAIPVGGGADKEAAEQIDGRFRHIEYASKATQHYQRALTAAARAGVGYITIRPEYVDRALNWQEPRIGSEPDALKVVFDPWSVDTDGGDANFGFILTTMSISSFERRWKGKKARDFGDTGSSGDSRKSVLVAEQWLKEDVSRNMVVYVGEDGEEQSAEEEDFRTQVQMSGVPVENLRTYVDKTHKVTWRQMSGEDILAESEFPADSIGIVPVYGYVAFVDGRMRYCGIPRRARAPQQAYNYHISEQLAFIGTAPKSPWLASKRATKGVEPLWDLASVNNRAWLPYNDQDEDGPINQPTRVNAASNLVNHQAGAEQALKDIQAAIGLYQANLGAPSNETSGVAIEGRKEQGEASTAHFPSHMAASLGQVGQIVMQMDARLSDTRRKQPILGVDGAAGSVTVDPEQDSAFQRGPEGVTINPTKGKYGVRVVVGASYSTQRTQTNAAFAEIMRGNKELAPTVAPFWAQTLDFPGSDKFAQAMAAMAPPPVKAILQPEDGEKKIDPAEMAAALAQCQAALQEATQIAHEAESDAQEANDKLNAKEEENKVRQYEAETNRLKVTGANEEQIQAIVQELVEQMLAGEAPLPGDGEPLPGAEMGTNQPETGMPAAPAAPPEPDPKVVALEQKATELETTFGQKSQALEATVKQLQDAVTRHESLRLDEKIQALLEQNKALIAAVKAPRKRTPVKDKDGSITHVIDTPEDDK
jgi:hypothetical protein